MRITAKEQQHETRERILPPRPWKNNTATTAYFKVTVLGVEGMLQIGKREGPQHGKEYDI